MIAALLGQTMKILSYDDLKARGIAYSKVHLWRLEKARKFPKRVPLSEARHGWLETEIDGWLATRIAARHAEAAI
jgi:prophage regulatory protein